MSELITVQCLMYFQKMSMANGEYLVGGKRQGGRRDESGFGQTYIANNHTSFVI